MKRFVLVSLFVVTPLFGQQSVGRFEPGAIYREPERNAPPSVSRMFVRQVEGHEVDLPATGGSGMIIALPGRAPSTMKLSSGMQRVALDATHDVIHIDRTEAQRYHFADLKDGIVVASEPESRVTMTSTVGPLSRMPGQAVTLHASLRDGDDAITRARVNAHLVSPDNVEQELALREVANGEYEAVINDLPSKAHGFWTVRYEADGTTLHGVEFARNGSNQFMNERASARLHDLRIERTGDTLHVTAIADVAIAGRYRFDVISASARDAQGERHGLAWGESEATLAIGSTELELDLPVSEQQVFTDVRLLSLDTMGVASRLTIAPAHERFER